MAHRLVLLSLVLLGCGAPSEDGEARSVSAALRSACPCASNFAVTTPEATIDVIGRPSVNGCTWDRRVLLMLTGAMVTARAYDADVPGYNALDRAAQAGFYAFAMTYEGYGESSRPADGRDVEPQRMARAAGAVIEALRQRYRVDEVDLFGASIGALIAAHLGGLDSPIDRRHVGRVVLNGIVYRPIPPGAFPPGDANGYLTTEPATYAPLLADAEPDVQAWGLATFPGDYAIGPTLAAASLPIFDMKRARAPALLVWGARDGLTPRGDVDAFRADYGGPITMVVLPAAGHVPFYHSSAEDFWTTVFGFLKA
jgi:pimeloyl-ACP methyl ester carboxylesterase